MKNYVEFVKESEDIKIDIQKLYDKLRDEIPKLVPFFSQNKIGGYADYYHLFVVGFQDKKEWVNGYLENSNYFRMSVDCRNGKIDVFSQSLYQKGTRPSFETRLPIRFRRTTAKNIDDAMKKIIGYIEDVKKFYK